MLKKVLFINEGVYTSVDGLSEINNLHFLVHGIYSVVHDLDDDYLWLAKIKFRGESSIVATYIDSPETFELVMEAIGSDN